jgi:hypothetical protein
MNDVILVRIVVPKSFLMDDECLRYEGSSAKRRKQGHVEEVDVGITEYVNTADRFSGIIKQR